VTTSIKQGGIETFYWEVAKELQDRGIEVELISGQGNFIKYSNIHLKQFDFTSRNKIIDLGNRFRKWGERISFFKNAYPYLKKQNYDYFLIHKPLDFFTAYFMKKINPNLKVIFVSGGEDFYGFDKFFSKYIDYMFAVSRNNANIIKNRYKRNVQILHNGVDIEVFKKDETARKHLREKYNLNNKKVLISVGRIVALKGYQLVIKSLKDLKDIYYVLIGNGEYLNDLKKLAKKENVEDKVLFLGEVKNKELNKFLSVGDVFVQPTIGNEAFGITIIEAMACGLPVVASKNGGILDIISDGKNGYLFEINNIDEMKEKIKHAFNSKINSKEYVIDNFTWKKTVDKLLQGINK
jgi:glycosyltransferase involved in cell wall biosynthesis